MFQNKYFQIKNGINLLVLFMYSRYLSPKYTRHSFSSNFAVRNRNNVDNKEINSNIAVVFLK